ncbi:nucleolar protein 14 [Cynoglossus semilaevis]|uniref:NOP14 nucleolar protein homolog (yeast) n=1 Tax=Cynoglossus semilaevis TaxID=244447 RepID=A0A3P8X081_CYNSE|nr:nucleolar protein 14 [Cynoglossus semilaevis]
MGKVPKKKNLADKVRKAKTSTEIKNNPFEVKINRKKFDVLGRKTKHDVGLPGVSRSKAINKRKETLLKEFKQKNKSSKFIDRRFGEYDTKMAPEDKILKRFAMERQRVHEKKDMYNLNEEEELTHYGQSLAEMEKFTDAVNSDDESEEKGLLSAELTASHFGGGGGLLRRKTGDKSEEEGNQRAKSRQELIEELIQKSKQEKRERQAQKEESQVLTEKLDQEWKNIQALIVKKTPKADKPEEKPKLDEYDMRVRELGFEMKAQPSEKMKTPEQLAREEREKLQKLEADRLRRMMGDEAVDSAPTRNHISADDLNDGFILDKNDKKTLSYKDGKWNIGEEEGGDDEEEGENGEEAELEAEEEDEDEEGEEEEEEGELEDEGDEEEEGSELEEEGDEEEEEGGSEADGHSDLDSDQESEDEGKVQKDEEEDGAKSKSLTKEEVKAQQEAAKAELPYTFTAPESYNDLKDLLSGHTSDNQRLIVARTQKCNHPSLAVGNKLKLQKLFGFLLEYIGELATRSPPELRTIDKLIPELYALCQMFPEAACKAMQTVLADDAHSMEEVLEVKGRIPFPSLEMLIYLKVTALLFPTSDFRHPVTTPALLYISQALTKCPVRSLQDVTSGLLLCCLAVEYVSFSKRFVPELINFLAGTLHLAVKDKTSLGYTVAPPFRSSGKNCDLLLVSDAESSQNWSKKQLRLSDTQHLELRTDLDRDHHRLMCLSTSLDLVKRCCLLYKELPSFPHIFQPIRTLLSKHLSSQMLPESLQELHSSILENISSSSVPNNRLVFEKKKPIPLKLFTPKIVEVLDYGKKRGCSKEERDKERLKHKYKKEFKGALREIRKDSRFLAREKLSEVMNRDSDRKRKVKELMGSLATQEGEWKALKRKKRK